MVRRRVWESIQDRQPVLLKAFFWPKDLRESFHLQCSAWLSPKPHVHGLRAWKAHFGSRHSGRSFAQKKRFRMTDAESVVDDEFRHTLAVIGKQNHTPGMEPHNIFSRIH